MTVALAERRVDVGAAAPSSPDRFAWGGETAVLATMHGKARAIAPPLQRLLGMQVDTAVGIDTDQFGTFTREIARAGTQLEAARAKIAAAFSAAPEARLALASEGSFGPHPAIPFVPLGREIVLLVDRQTGVELIGHDATLTPRFEHVVAHNVSEAQSFAERVGFPRQRVIVMTSVEGAPNPRSFLCKSADDPQALIDAVVGALNISGAAHLECDMRAHRNPTRMAAIRRATVDLVRAYRERCPSCEQPGFVARRRVKGIPCAWCGTATEEVRAVVRGCNGCGHEVEEVVGPATVDPGLCQSCNP